MTSDDPPSSPMASGSAEEELAYYKSQYEQLEVELQEFQQSSRELETELEKDIEASEKRERQLQEKVESLRFEVDEWKAKYKQSKSEASTAQNSLQKEITTLRETSRNLQLKLRDMEVANDDFERQARNQSSSLEDLEHKYNVAIERGVILEEEIKVGEKERECLRIESQRLREELSDLKIEAEITQGKLRFAESTIEQYNSRKPRLLAPESLRPRSPISETSTSATTLSSPTASTPPPSKSEASVSATPPSPPLSEVSATAKNVPQTPSLRRKTSIAIDANTTPRPGYYASKAPRHSRGPSIPVSAGGRTTPSLARQSTTGTTRSSRPSTYSSETMPRSGSLYQIRGLIRNMQKLEERVHSVRSKLPAPTATPPRASPRNSSQIPSSITIRSARRRPSHSVSSSINGDTPSGAGKAGGSSSRLSFGTPAPVGSSRPSSRASITSHASMPAHYARPPSRTSTRTPLNTYSGSSTTVRPRSSMSGSYAALHGHGHSASITDIQEKEGGAGHNVGVIGARTPVMRRTSTAGISSIPTPTTTLPRRQSGGFHATARRSSASGEGHGHGHNDMGPPQPRRKLSEVGETY